MVGPPAPPAENWDPAGGRSPTWLQPEIPRGKGCLNGEHSTTRLTVPPCCARPAGPAVPRICRWHLLLLRPPKHGPLDRGFPSVGVATLDSRRPGVFPWLTLHTRMPTVPAHAIWRSAGTEGFAENIQPVPTHAPRWCHQRRQSRIGDIDSWVKTYASVSRCAAAACGASTELGCGAHCLFSQSAGKLGSTKAGRGMEDGRLSRRHLFVRSDPGPARCDWQEGEFSARWSGR